MNGDAAPRLHALSFRELLDEGVHLVRAHFRRLFLPFAVPVALGALVMTIGQARFLGGMSEFARPGGNPFALVSTFGSFLVVAVLYILLFGIAHTAMLGAMVGAADGRPMEPGQAWRWAVSGRVLGTFMLTGAAVGLGLLFCIVPGLVLGLRFWLVGAVMAAEGKHGTEALRRSWRLLLHNPERRFSTSPQVKVVAIVLAGWLVSSAASMAVNLPFTIAQQVVAFRSIAGAQGPPDPSTYFGSLLWLQAPQAVLSALVGVAVGLYANALTALFFLDLRRRVEGGDLEAALDGLGAPRPETVPSP